MTTMAFTQAMSSFSQSVAGTRVAGRSVQARTALNTRVSAIAGNPFEVWAEHWALGAAGRHRQTTPELGREAGFPPHLAAPSSPLPLHRLQEELKATAKYISQRGRGILVRGAAHRHLAAAALRASRPDSRSQRRLPCRPRTSPT